MSKWISVEDELPDPRVEVLACFRGQFHWVYFVAQNYGEKLFAPQYAEPTHWQPLPEPPESI